MDTLKRTKSLTDYYLQDGASPQPQQEPTHAVAYGFGKLLGWTVMIGALVVFFNVFGLALGVIIILLCMIADKK
jgi:hypothetical protein